MALSGQADSRQNGAEHDTSDKIITDDTCSTQATGFVPNPAAKPFFPAESNNSPSGMKLKWQKQNNPVFYTGHSQKGSQNATLQQMTGMEEHLHGFSLDIFDHGSLYPSLSHSSPNNEEDVPPLMIPPCNIEQVQEDGQTKKHIAYHLLSTVLDDDILEDQGQFPMDNLLIDEDNRTKRFQRSDSWPVSASSLSSNFSLSLDLNEHCNQTTAGLGNRSIHEIWSPKPSPRDSYPSTPGDENAPYCHITLDPFGSGGLIRTDYKGESAPDDAETAGTPRSAPSHSAESPPFAPMFDEFYCKDRARSLPHSLRGPAPCQQSRCHANQQSALQGRYSKRAHSTDGYVNDSREYRKSFSYNDVVAENSVLGSTPINGSTKLHYNNNGKEYGDAFRMHAAEKLGSCLDDCLDQLRNLERECRKAEQELSKVYPPRRPSSNGAIHAPRLPPGPTRVDRMIVEQTKEHNKVESLIGRIERLSRSPMHSNVGVALDQWLACIKELQVTRKDEIASSQASSGYGTKSYAIKDLLALSHVVLELIGHTRSARTIVWCAMQMLHVDDEWLQSSDTS